MVDQMETYCFIKKEQPKASPIWLGRTLQFGPHQKGYSNQRKGQSGVFFSECSNSKEVFLTPDIVEYDEDTFGKPAFDLIIGAQTMSELGIILDFKEQITTIDDIKLPMQSINELPSLNKEALSYQIV